MLFSRSLAAAVLILCSAGCGVDESHTGLGLGAVPGDPLYPADEADGGTQVTCVCPGPACAADAEGADVEVVELPDLTGNGYRFETLALTAPLTGEMAGMINDYFATEIAAENLNILLHVTTDDPASGDLVFAVGAGSKSDQGYSFGSDPGELTCALSGTKLETKSGTDLDFPNGLLDPPMLPITDLRIMGTFDAEGYALSGTLEGTLTGPDAEAVKLLGTDFKTMLINFNAPPDLDTNDDGEADAWTFLFDFDAAQADVAMGGE